MSAIITENFRRNNTSAFIDDVSNPANTYYVGLGKSDPWNSDEVADPTVPTPIGTALDERETKNNLITLIGVTAANATKVIPTNKFVSYTYYNAYDPLNDNCFYTTTSLSGIKYLPCYVLVGDQLFLCLYAPAVVATVVPTVASDAVKYTPFVTSDGYVWILLDTINTSSVNTVNTDQFISITLDTSASTALANIATQQGGLLYGFTIINGGSGYSVADTFTYKYKLSSGATGTLTLDKVIGTVGAVSGVVTSLSYANIVSVPITEIISGNIVVSTSTGSDFSAIAKIAPITGFAHTPYKILPSWYAAISVKATALVSGDGFYIPYRQVSIIKNPSTNPGLVTGETATSLRALPYLILSDDPTSELVTGDVLTVNTTTKIIYDTYIAPNLYYHQNNVSDYGTVDWSVDNTIKRGVNPIGTCTVTGGVLGEYAEDSGDIIFIENRKAITRSESQTEEIKLILQF